MDYMPAELTSTSGGWKTWKFTCDLCARSLLTSLQHETVATDMARTNGWITDQTTLCPACATVTQKLEQNPGDQQTDRPHAS